MMNLSVDMLEVLSDILVEKALVNMNLGLRREVEAAPIWLWMRWPKRRLQKGKGPGDRKLQRTYIWQQGKEGQAVRDARGKSPGGASNSNDQEEKVTRSGVIIPYAGEKSEGEEGNP